MIKIFLNLCIVFNTVFMIFDVYAQTNKKYHFVRIKGLSEQVVGEKLLFEIYQRAKIPIDITPMTGSRALAEASSGRKDGETLRVFALGNKYPSLIRVPTAISTLTTQGFSAKNIDINTAEDLKKYSLVRVRGVQHTKNITQSLKNVHVLPTSELLIEFLGRGRADVGLTGRLNGLSLIKASGLSQVTIVGKPLKVLPLYHYIHKKNKALVPRIDAIIKQMVDSGDMKKLREKYEREYLDSINPIR